VGLSGLLWLFLSYGYVLYYASNLISEGSELLLLVPSLAGLVGGVVLPMLGAVPDGAIILFSGLNPDKETAQETLSVGVGALAGSTIMLLTIPWAMSVYAGRVDIDPHTKTPNYLVVHGSKKLTFPHPDGRVKGDLHQTGVTLTPAVHHGAIIMMCTTIPYFLIQIPAHFLHGPMDEIARGEHWWSLAGLISCLAGLLIYLYMQLKISADGKDRLKRLAVTRKLLKQGAVSLSGAVAAAIHIEEARAGPANLGEYQSVADQSSTNNSGVLYPSPVVAAYLRDILADAFYQYDTDGNGQLDVAETFVFFRDLHETITEEEMKELFNQYDTDSSGAISFDEFIGVAYSLIKTQENRGNEEMSASARHIATGVRSAHQMLASAAVGRTNGEADAEGDDNDGAEVEEEEEVPEEFTHLSPEQQQTAIKKRAFQMLAAGTFLVVFFSDPMVDVMQEIAVRGHMNPFYVSFVLAPLASNASEVVSSMYYASKKTRKTITVSLSTLEGAACMNNTFCLSIFMALIFFRGLAWQYTAETIAIIVVEFFVGILALRSNVMTLGRSLLILATFPLSLVLVATLEHLGFD
jgi:Ca2+/Na+ antiporter